MGDRRFAMTANNLPQTVPLFPLGGALLLPGGELPLNIFEPRYVQMIKDVMATRHPYIGIIQPKGPCNCGCSCGNATPLYDTGCMGKITSFTETPDGRYLITVVGICRFTLTEELPSATPYRIARARWDDFSDIDLKPCTSCIKKIKPDLIERLHPFFEAHNMEVDWQKIDEIADDRLMTCLSMICPFDPAEQQALLEAPTQNKRCELMITMIDFALKSMGQSEQH